MLQYLRYTMKQSNNYCLNKVSFYRMVFKSKEGKYYKSLTKKLVVGRVRPMWHETC